MDEIIFDEVLPSYMRRDHIIQIMLSRYKCLEVLPVSKSLAGRNIYAINMGNKASSVLLTGAYHGMEWMTSLVLLKFAYDVCEGIEKNDKNFAVLDKRGITILPCVNPDGVEISLFGACMAGAYKSLIERIGDINDIKTWQANARGVDINHNFNAGWEDLHNREIEKGIIGPSRSRFGGDFPESEPETRAVTKLCRERIFEHAIALHSQGEEIYWDYGKNTPSCSIKMAKEISRLSGYKVSNPEGLAIGGGFKDWFINEFKKPAFTIEIGKGKNPLPLIDFRNIYNKLKKVLIFLINYGL